MPFPSTDAVTFTLLHDTDAGPYMGRSDRPATYQAIPGYLVVCDPYEFVIDWYERYSDESADPLEFPSAALCNLYITIAGSAMSRTLVVAGEAIETVTIGETDYYMRTRFKIPNDTLPTTLVSSDQVRLIFQVTDASGNEIVTAFLDTCLLDENGNPGAELDITSQYLNTTQISLTADTVLTAYPGFVRYLADGTSATVAITLPAPAAYAAQWIEVVAVNVDHAVTVAVPSGTFRGVSDASIAFAAVNDAVQFISDGTYWYCLNIPGVVL